MSHYNHYIEDLNDEQKIAVEALEGPLLILAGAGTGKTRVLTTRVVNILLQGKALPGQILAVTFTNKAVKEMQIRIQKMLLEQYPMQWCGTFHSISARILRNHSERIDFSSNFTIINKDDQLRLMKQIIKDCNLDEKKYPAKMFINIIGRYKDKALSPQYVQQDKYVYYDNGITLSIYKEYQKRLRLLQAMDFGDLIMSVIELFNANLDLLEYYQRKFKYVMVDEYQDTNVAQYLWLRLLVQMNNNICCVGDDDQSIYGWRGAEVKNILRFEKDFPNAKVVRLERNYRSTNSILKAATHIIANNKNRHGKTLWTDNQASELIKLSIFYDNIQESKVIADEIDVKSRLHNNSLNGMAVLVRAGYQTRVFEENFNYMKIPYRIIGGAKFYDRMEIKDMLSYIRLLHNANDNLAFERIVNTPKRSIGDVTVAEIRVTANTRNISMMQAAKIMIEEGLIKGKTSIALKAFLDLFDKCSIAVQSLYYGQVVSTLFEESGYKEMLQKQEAEEAKERLDNVKELIGALTEFSSLQEYIEHISLLSDNDANAEENKVSIMTIHAAKGLEFDTIFLPGWEEGVFPSPRSTAEDDDGASLEEERRLAYVAITRAKQNLHISYACNRKTFGYVEQSKASRFIDELPEDSYEIMHNFGAFRNQSYAKNMILERSKEIEYDDDQYASNMDRSWKYGQNVAHRIFGKGKIIAMLENNIAQVMFEKSGFKKISTEYLEII